MKHFVNRDGYMPDFGPTPPEQERVIKAVARQQEQDDFYRLLEKEFREREDVLFGAKNGPKSEQLSRRGERVRNAAAAIQHNVDNGFDPVMGSELGRGRTLSGAQKVVSIKPEPIRGTASFTTAQAQPRRDYMRSHSVESFKALLFERIKERFEVNRIDHVINHGQQGVVYIMEHGHGRSAMKTMYMIEKDIFQTAHDPEWIAAAVADEMIRSALGQGPPAETIVQKLRAHGHEPKQNLGKPLSKEDFEAIPSPAQSREYREPKSRKMARDHDQRSRLDVDYRAALELQPDEVGRSGWDAVAKAMAAEGRSADEVRLVKRMFSRYFKNR